MNKKEIENLFELHSSLEGRPIAHSILEGYINALDKYLEKHIPKLKNLGLIYKSGTNRYHSCSSNKCNVEVFSQALHLRGYQYVEVIKPWHTYTTNLVHCDSCTKPIDVSIKATPVKVNIPLTRDFLNNEEEVLNIYMLINDMKNRNSHKFARNFKPFTLFVNKLTKLISGIEGSTKWI